MSERKQYWSDHLDRIAAEGISTRAYARREGLSAAALYDWRRRLKAQAAPVTPVPNGVSSGRCLVPIRITDARSPCTLTLAPGVQLALSELPSPDWLAQVVVAQSTGRR